MALVIGTLFWHSDISLQGLFSATLLRKTLLGSAAYFAWWLDPDRGLRCKAALVTYSHEGQQHNFIFAGSRNFFGVMFFSIMFLVSIRYFPHTRKYSMQEGHIACLRVLYNALRVRMPQPPGMLTQAMGSMPQMALTLQNKS